MSRSIAKTPGLQGREWRRLLRRASAGAKAVCLAKVAEEAYAGSPATIARRLLARTLEHVRAVRKLIKLGQVTEARILLRASCENLIWIGALAADPGGFAQKILADDAAQRAKEAKALLGDERRTPERRSKTLRRWSPS